MDSSSEEASFGNGGMLAGGKLFADLSHLFRGQIVNAQADQIDDQADDRQPVHSQKANGEERGTVWGLGGGKLTGKTDQCTEDRNHSRPKGGNDLVGQVEQRADHAGAVIAAAVLFIVDDIGQQRRHAVRSDHAEALHSAPEHDKAYGEEGPSVISFVAGERESMGIAKDPQQDAEDAHDEPTPAGKPQGAFGTEFAPDGSKPQKDHEDGRPHGVAVGRRTELGVARNDCIHNDNDCGVALQRGGQFVRSGGKDEHQQVLIVCQKTKAFFQAEIGTADGLSFRALFIVLAERENGKRDADQRNRRNIAEQCGEKFEVEPMRHRQDVGENQNRHTAVQKRQGDAVQHAHSRTLFRIIGQKLNVCTECTGLHRGHQDKNQIDQDKDGFAQRTLCDQWGQIDQGMAGEKTSDPTCDHKGAELAQTGIRAIHDHPHAHIRHRIPDAEDGDEGTGDNDAEPDDGSQVVRDVSGVANIDVDGNGHGRCQNHLKPGCTPELRRCFVHDKSS